MAPRKRKPFAEPQAPQPDMPEEEFVPAEQEPPKPQQSASELYLALKAIIGDLQREADDRVQQRINIEKRWLADLRQKHGEYEPKVKAELATAEKSQLFINQTRPKTNTCAARLFDMLFPTDDKNWGIAPTPVPTLTAQAKKAVDAAEKMAEAANAKLAQGDEAGAAQLAEQGNVIAGTKARLEKEMAEAKKRAEAMQDEIEDQLKECEFAASARLVIDDACDIGTGIVKGPVGTMEHSRRSWQKRQDATEGSAAVYELTFEDDTRPAYYWVDPWSFFPASDARNMMESDSTYERHILTEKGMRRLAKMPGFDKDAIRRLLRDGAKEAIPTYLSDIRAIKGEQALPTETRFIAWEYRGPLTADKLMQVCSCLGTEQAKGIANLYPDPDPLIEIQVVMWFCQGELLKFGIGHLDSAESVYSVYNLEKDPASIWGFGIPYLMRDSQKALNAAWRMMMDNAGLSSGPQIEIDPQVIKPADGTYSLYPRKVWLRQTTALANKPGLITYDIPSHQDELAAIIMLAKQFIDDETSISVLAQGEQGAHTTQTAQGMAILMNGINVVFRRFVKNFDDQFTVPCIRRLYDWNMQFSKRDDIKGDFDVDARGTSVLLVRELQSQNLLVLAGFTAHPVLGMLLKGANVLRKLSQSMMIAPDDIILTDDEIEAQAKKLASQGNPEDAKLAMQAKIAADNNKTKLDIAQLENETARIKFAEDHNMSLEKLNAMLQGMRMQTDSKERIFAAEAAVEATRPADEGSGGYISGGGGKATKKPKAKQTKTRVSGIAAA